MLKEFKIDTSSWKNKIDTHKLPIFALIPNKGVRIILEKYILRSLINVSGEEIDQSYKDSTDVFELLDIWRI